MMKNLLALVSAALLSFSVHAAKFTEGDYYKVLDQPQSTTPVVTEFFSLYCPHCYQFEPMIRQLPKTLLPLLVAMLTVVWMVHYLCLLMALVIDRKSVV